MSLRPKRTRRQTRLRWLSRAIGPAILAVILWRLDLGATVAAIRQAAPAPLALAYLMFVPTLFVRAWRWQVLMAPQRIHIPYRESLAMYAFSIFVGTVTPGHVGEFVKALYLKQKGHSLGASFFSVFLDRLLDILVLVLFGCGALSAVVIPDAGAAMTTTLIVGGVAGAVAMIWAATRGRGRDWTLRLLEAAAPRKWRERSTRGYRDFSDGFRKMKLPGLLAAVALTALAWAGNYCAVYLLGRALGFDISYFQMACMAAVCALITLIPISVMGVGTRDAALIAMLAQYGVPKPGAVALSTLILSMLLCNAAICSLSLLTPVGRFQWRGDVESLQKEAG